MALNGRNASRTCVLANESSVLRNTASGTQIWSSICTMRLSSTYTKAFGAEHDGDSVHDLQTRSLPLKSPSTHRYIRWYYIQSYVV